MKKKKKTLIHTDPFNSGLTTTPMKEGEEPKNTLDRIGLDEDQCCGETIYWVVVDHQGNCFDGEENYT